MGHTGRNEEGNGENPTGKKGDEAKRVKATRRFKKERRKKVRFLFRSGLILTQENRLRNLGLLTGASLETDT
jgi:hypothetical protein